MYIDGDAPTHEMVRPETRRERFRKIAGDVREVALTGFAICGCLTGATLLVGAIRVLTEIW